MMTERKDQDTSRHGRNKPLSLVRGSRLRLLLRSQYRYEGATHATVECYFWPPGLDTICRWRQSGFGLNRGEWTKRLFPFQLCSP
jgi:hypothetical protein